MDRCQTCPSFPLYIQTNVEGSENLTDPVVRCCQTPGHWMHFTHSKHSPLCTLTRCTIKDVPPDPSHQNLGLDETQK